MAVNCERPEGRLLETDRSALIDAERWVWMFGQTRSCRAGSLNHSLTYSYLRYLGTVVLL